MGSYILVHHALRREAFQSEVIHFQWFMIWWMDGTCFSV